MNEPRGSFSPSGPGTVWVPSESSTTRAGGGPSASGAPASERENVSIDCRAVNMASPVAVDSASCRLSTARLTAFRSVVGDTSTAAVPANDTSPRFTPGVSWSANDFAAACAAASRVGATSVAFIDSDTSITSITVARLRGTFAIACGAASATVSTASAMISATAGTCRTQPGLRGATVSSSSRFVNRTTSRRRRRNSHQ